MRGYGVTDIMNSMHMENAMEGYANCVTDMLVSADFRDMYMDTMEAYLTGDTSAIRSTYGDPTNEAIENVLDDYGLNCDTDMSVPTQEGRFYGAECGGSCECGGLNEELPMYDDLSVDSCDEYTRKSLKRIPAGDPADAGTFFNLKDARPSVECAESSQEMIDLISATVPDTDLASAVESYHAEGPEPAPYMGDVTESYADDVDLDVLEIGL